MSTTRDVEKIMGVSDAVARDWSRHLDMESVPRARVPRLWTTNDVAQLLIAQKLNERGLSVAVSLALTRAMAKHFVAITVSEAPCWLLAWPNDEEASGWSSEIYFDSAACLEVILDHPNAIILNVLDMLKEALWTILQARREENRHA